MSLRRVITDIASAKTDDGLLVQKAMAGLFKLEVFAEGDDLLRVRDAIICIHHLSAKVEAARAAKDDEI